MIDPSETRKGTLYALAARGWPVLLAVAGSTVLAIGIDRVPWITLVLAFSFGFYGLLRTTVRLESVNGLLIETGLLSPLALFWVIHLMRTASPSR